MSAVRSPRKNPDDAAAVAREFEISFGAGDFDRVRQLIYRKAGISLHEGKQAMVYSRLSRRLLRAGPWLDRQLPAMPGKRHRGAG